jgi:hypothetical protein
LQLTICPACLSELQEPPAIENEQCTLCGSHISQAAVNSSTESTAQGELRALKRRLSELEAYIARLEDDLVRLEGAELAATDRYQAAAASVESTSELPAPFLALRDDLQNQIASLLVDQRQIQTGLRLWQSVADADQRVETLSARVRRLREERANFSSKVDRSTVIGALSSRFGQILTDIGYPKLSDPYIDENLVPHVRGLPYSSASSGGQVLISLAWYLSLWEVSYESDARAPGLLMIDSPQKNLGYRAVAAGDSDFGDFSLVSNFYGHVKEWLAGPGSGAQLIVVDNTPPESMAEDVVIRFTRDPNVPPYGLIVDAVD